MAVEVDALSAVGGLVQAGDRVDVILSVSDDDSKFPVFGPGVGGSPTSVEDDTVNNTSIKVLVQNVPVLSLVAPEPTEAEAEGQASAKEPQAMAILGVTPEQTELIRFAQLDGNLTLVLRAPGDQTTADVTTNGVTLRRLVEEYGVLPPRIVVGE
jgi:Flp pilus assembly protein CpaB